MICNFGAKTKKFHYEKHLEEYLFMKRKKEMILYYLMLMSLVELALNLLFKNSDVGIIPVVSTFAVFGTMRAHEQFRTAIAYPNRNVKLCCSHLGVDVGPDGATAQMLEDLAIMRSIPNVTVVIPADANELMKAFPAILDEKGPVYMRIGRSPASVIFDSKHKFEIGKATRVKDGKDVTVIATGVMVARAVEAAIVLHKEDISVRVVNFSTIKPLDDKEILSAAKETEAIVTAEDHNVMGGMGSAVAEFIVENCPVRMEIIGVQDRFGKSGEPQELAEYFGLTAEHICKAVKEILKRKG
ncbi:1-deoxy-D-xylulose-5-phosphate synthase [subsurface metagenome]